MTMNTFCLSLYTIVVLLYGSCTAPSHHVDVLFRYSVIWKMNLVNMACYVITNNTNPFATITVLLWDPRCKSICTIYEAMLEPEKCLSFVIHA
ncbi:hypothetical protein L1987_35361 [Smallanthus sonchifolius]|uniref:Uncharacterized protein n=1 Tax=Smallanthus sonchifolius TaxID=185202 RepID=A0ACB9HW92_9ASTR|nr:hypothetical protein L1987_35361 [Smallanthus sonchifolius]